MNSLASGYGSHEDREKIIRRNEGLGMSEGKQISNIAQIAKECPRSLKKCTVFTGQQNGTEKSKKIIVYPLCTQIERMKNAGFLVKFRLFPFGLHFAECCVLAHTISSDAKFLLFPCSVVSHLE